MVSFHLVVLYCPQTLAFQDPGMTRSRKPWWYTR